MTANGHEVTLNSGFRLHDSWDANCPTTELRRHAQTPSWRCIIETSVSSQAHIVRFKMYESQLFYLIDTALTVGCSLNTLKPQEKLPYIRAPVSFCMFIVSERPISLKFRLVI